MSQILILTYFSPVWMASLSLMALIGFIQFLIWRRLKNVGGIYRIASLARDAAGIPTYSRSLHQLNLELDSSRRYQRPLSIAVLTLASGNFADARFSNKSRSEGQRPASSSLPFTDAIHLVFPLIGPILQESLRSSDKVTFEPAHLEYVIVFTQTKKEQAGLAVERLKSGLAAKAHVRLDSGLAEFPTDGFTLTDVISRARAQSASQTELEELMTKTPVDMGRDEFEPAITEKHPLNS